MELVRSPAAALMFGSGFYVYPRNRSVTLLCHCYLASGILHPDAGAGPNTAPAVPTGMSAIAGNER